MQITGAELFVKALLAEQVDTIFAYPGGQAIDLFNALYGVEEIKVILPRHEQGLVHAADGYARSTGKVGVCLVTSGPGATNLVTGIATANYDSVPLVCFTGQVPTHLIGNDAFQEVDIVGITRSICKYAITVRKREDLASIIKKAFFIASSGKPGVVVVDLPKDIQQALGSDCYPEQIEVRGYKPNTNVHIGQIKKALALLKTAKRPVFLIGGGVNIAHAQQEMTQLAEKTGIPVITTIMGKGALPTDHPLYVGNLGIHGSYAANTAISECDVLFSIGVRFNDRITGKVNEFAKKATIIHVDIDPASISRNIIDVEGVRKIVERWIKVMGKLEKVIVENGITYVLGEDDIYYPDLQLPEGTNYNIGKFGHMRCEYLKEFKHGYYMELLLDGRLNEYLHDIDEECHEMLDRIVEQMKVKQGVTEQLKAENQMLWVGKMNNIIACAEEIVVREVVLK